MYTFSIDLVKTTCRNTLITIGTLFKNFVIINGGNKLIICLFSRPIYKISMQFGTFDVNTHVFDKNVRRQVFNSNCIRRKLF